MTVTELTDFLLSLPPEVQEYDVVMRDFKDMPDDAYAAIDKPIVTMYFDDDTQELCILDINATDFAEKNGILDLKD